MFLDNPIFGVGIKNFRNNCEYYRSGNFNIDDKTFYKKLNKKQKKNFLIIFVVLILIVPILSLSRRLVYMG